MKHYEGVAAADRKTARPAAAGASDQGADSAEIVCFKCGQTPAPGSFGRKGVREAIRPEHVNTSSGAVTVKVTHIGTQTVDDNNGGTTCDKLLRRMTTRSMHSE